jgi:Na+:H+ antiporter, NhaA family
MVHRMTKPDRPPSALRAFLNSEAAGGVILMGVALLALLLANSPLAPAYFGALKTYVAGLSVLHWINDALMAVFFLLVGLEIKREFLDGQLSTWPRRILPGIAAAGGMAVPALIYVALNAGDPTTLRGWAIPTATDIAFALGVLALLGSRVPVSLKVFLTALAIIDDLGAVAIIAIFYTAELSLMMLGLAAVTLFGLCLMNWTGVRALWPYLLVGAALWSFGTHNSTARHSWQTRGGRLAFASVGAWPAQVGFLPGHPDLRLCQCRGFLLRYRRGNVARIGSAWHCSRTVRR